MNLILTFFRNSLLMLLFQEPQLLELLQWIMMIFLAMIWLEIQFLILRIDFILTIGNRGLKNPSKLDNCIILLPQDLKENLPALLISSPNQQEQLLQIFSLNQNQNNNLK